MATATIKHPESVAMSSAGVDENTAASFTPTSPKKRKHGQVKLTDRRQPKEKVTCADDGCDAPVSPHGNHMGSLVKCRKHAVPAGPKLKRSKSMHHALNHAEDPADDDEETGGDSGEKYFFGLTKEESIWLFQSRWGSETFDFSGARLELPFGHVKTRYALVDYARCRTTKDRTLIILILAQARKLAKHYHFDIEPEIIHEAAKIVILNALNPTFTHVVRFTGRNGNILDNEVQIMLTKLEADAVLSTVGAFMDKHPLTDAENELLRITRMAEIGRQKPACESNVDATEESQPQQEVKKEPPIKPDGDGDDSGNDTDPLDNNDGDEDDSWNTCENDECTNKSGDSQLCRRCVEDAKVAHAESYTEIDESQRQ